MMINKVKDFLSFIKSEWVWLVLLIITMLFVVTLMGSKRTMRGMEEVISEQRVVIDSLMKECDRYSEMNGIMITVNFNVKSTNVLGINNNNCKAASESIAQYTKGEMLRALDSINTSKQR